MYGKKVEHKWFDGNEFKWCVGCKSYVEVDKFHTTNGRTYDNLYYICRDCYNKKRDASPRYNALRAWRHLNDRASNDERYIRKGIKVLVEKDDFVSWYCSHWFNGCKVDRINNDGHYELSNLQLISQLEHNEKVRSDRLKSLGVVETEGFRYCYGCNELKTIDDYFRSKRRVSRINPLGLKERCKKCQAQQRRSK